MLTGAISKTATLYSSAFFNRVASEVAPSEFERNYSEEISPVKFVHLLSSNKAQDTKY